MKKALLPFILVLTSCGTASAQVQNGGFEALNSAGMPAYWQGDLHIIPITIDSSGESHSDSVIVDTYLVNTAEPHTGQNAIELRNGYNFTVGEPIVGSWSASSDSAAYNGFPLVFVEVPQPPASVEFFAKFLPVAGDSAYVQATAYDGGLNEIGSGELSIIGTFADWTAFTLPVTYTSADPVIMFSLSFSTTKPGGQATFGTRFLIDDVGVTLVTGVDEQAGPRAMMLYPNPARDRFSVRTDAAVRSIRVFDAAGQEQPVLRNADGTVDASHLADGLYVVRILTAGGESRKTLMVQR